MKKEALHLKKIPLLRKEPVLPIISDQELSSDSNSSSDYSDSSDECDASWVRDSQEEQFKNLVRNQEKLEKRRLETEPPKLNLNNSDVVMSQSDSVQISMRPKKKKKRKSFRVEKLMKDNSDGMVDEKGHLTARTFVRKRSVSVSPRRKKGSRKKTKKYDTFNVSSLIRSTPDKNSGLVDDIRKSLTISLSSKHLVSKQPSSSLLSQWTPFLNPPINQNSLIPICDILLFNVRKCFGEIHSLFSKNQIQSIFSMTNQKSTPTLTTNDYNYKQAKTTITNSQLHSTATHVLYFPCSGKKRHW